jgi:hypothetical protein
MTTSTAQGFSPETTAWATGPVIPGLVQTNDNFLNAGGQLLNPVGVTSSYDPTTRSTTYEAGGSRRPQRCDPIRGLSALISP